MKPQEEGNHQAKPVIHISITSTLRDTEKKAALLNPVSPEHNTDTEPNTSYSSKYRAISARLLGKCHSRSRKVQLSFPYKQTPVRKP